MEVIERVSWTPEQSKIEKVLPGVLEGIRGNAHMRWFLGNGKDGTVFRMFNPADENDTSFDRFVIKDWNDRFKNRIGETDIQQMIADMKPRAFKVPRISLVNLKEGAFIMERVPGEDASRTLSRSHRLISEEMFEQVREAFRELNGLGFVHADAHQGNYMFSDPEFEMCDGREVLTDAQVWIIDFGQSRKGESPEDLEQIEHALLPRVYRPR